MQTTATVEQEQNNVSAIYILMPNEDEECDDE